MSLRDFVIESNAIEGIHREPTEAEIGATRTLLAMPRLGVGHLAAFVDTIAGAALRDQPGMDVRVGKHLPMGGGPNVLAELRGLLNLVEDGTISPFDAHIRYETLHPFMDGNGRSGRALWAWQMQRDGLDPFQLPFLHRFYYQTLDASGERA